MTLLLSVTAVLTAASVVTNVLAYLGHDHLLGMYHRLNLDSEANIPTWFSAALLFSCSLVLLAITTKTRGRPFHRHWLILAILFLLMACDESAALHDMITPLLQNRLEFRTSGWIRFSWVLFPLTILPVFMVAYIRFLLNLPQTIRRRFVLSGTTYLGGALGMELVGGKVHETFGYNSIAYAACFTIEECLEMLGLIAFIWTLLGYLEILCSLELMLNTSLDRTRIPISSQTATLPDRSPQTISKEAHSLNCNCASREADSSQQTS